MKVTVDSEKTYVTAVEAAGWIVVVGIALPVAYVSDRAGGAAFVLANTTAKVAQPGYDQARQAAAPSHSRAALLDFRPSAPLVAALLNVRYTHE